MALISRTAAWLADPAHWAGPAGIPARLGEHILLSGVSLLVAVAIALPVGLWIGHTGRGARLAVNLANLWRALPSIAIIAIALPITSSIDPQAGFKFYPTVIAMIVLGIPPILINAYSGIADVDREIIEAGRGQGMSEVQILRRVEIPLAVPAMVGGIASAAIQIIATATLGAIFGFGGLGRYLVDGLAQADVGQTVGGAVLVGALVIAAEGAFAVVQLAVTPRGLRLGREWIALPSA